MKSAANAQDVARLARVSQSAVSRSFTAGASVSDAANAATCTLCAEPEHPDALFVANDHMVIAAMDVLRFELGLRIPQDVSVVIPCRLVERATVRAAAPQ